MTTAQTKSGKWGAVALPAASVANGVLNSGILAISARQGQTGQIAAYAIVVALLALVSIAAGGGSGLLYLSGTDDEREAVRSQRLLIVLPALILATIGIGFWYAPHGYGWSAILLSGVVVLGNNLGELQYGDLSRQARFYESAVVGPASKIPAIVLIFMGVPLTVTLTVSVLVQFFANEALLWKTCTWLRMDALRRVSYRSAVSALFMGRRLFSYSAVELFNGRAATIAVSFFATPAVMGTFGAILSMYQGAVAVFYSALQVPMAARVRKRHGLGGFSRRESRSEILAIVAVFVFSVALYFAAPWVVREGLNLVDQDSVSWLRVLAAALPFCLVNRAVAMYFIGKGEYRHATRAVIPVALTMTVSLAALLPVLGATGAAISTLSAELLAACIFSLRLAFKRLGKGASTRSPEIGKMATYQ
jgi:O-antigen/teichoic acid export membrane protein